MKAPRSSVWRGRAVAAALAALAAVGLLVLALPALASGVRANAAWEIRAVEVVPVSASGEPLLAFVAADCEGCRGPLLQLRICPAAAAGESVETGCDVAARRMPAAGGLTVLRYARPLTSGRYRVEVLFLARDALGASRSVARVESTVDVR